MAETAHLPGAAIARATGRGVRIGVIDSGVHPQHPHIGRLGGGAWITVDGVVDGLDAARDQLGHGTAVMAAIQEKAPDAACYAVKVFDAALRTRATTLIRAIDWCVEAGMDLVNLSLGTVNPAHRPGLAEAVARARAAGCLLVAARAADAAPCLPGSLPGVLGIGLDWTCAREGYRATAAGFDASGLPRPIPGLPPQRNLMGISFAVANMTGFAARACERAGGSRSAGRLAAIPALLARAAT